MRNKEACRYWHASCYMYKVVVCFVCWQGETVSKEIQPGIISGERSTPMNMMLIDDDQDCILGLAGVLEPTGHSCEMFTVPEQAVQLYDGQHYDIVITDMKMPGMNGIEVLRLIRERNPAAKVIIITGYGDAEGAMSAVKFGAYAFFCKPINVAELIEMIEKIDGELNLEQQSKLEQKGLTV